MRDPVGEAIKYDFINCISGLHLSQINWMEKTCRVRCRGNFEKGKYKFLILKFSFCSIQKFVQLLEEPPSVIFVTTKGKKQLHALELHVFNKKS